MLKEIRHGLAMRRESFGLVLADVGDEGDRQRQIRFGPQITDLAGLTIVGQSDLSGCEISHRRGIAAGDGTGYLNEIIARGNGGVLLRRGDQAEGKGGDETKLQQLNYPSAARFGVGRMANALVSEEERTAKLNR